MFYEYLYQQNENASIYLTTCSLLTYSHIDQSGTVLIFEIHNEE